MIGRRGFLKLIGLAAAAPAIVSLPLEAAVPVPVAAVAAIPARGIGTTVEALSAALRRTYARDFLFDSCETEVLKRV